MGCHFSYAPVSLSDFAFSASEVLLGSALLPDVLVHTSTFLSIKTHVFYLHTIFFNSYFQNKPYFST